MRPRPLDLCTAFFAMLCGLLTFEPLTIETHEIGLAVSERYRLPVYVGLIVGAALLAGCDTHRSEATMSLYLRSVLGASS